MSKRTLKCPRCGDDGAIAGDDDWFIDGQVLVCGCPGWVTVEETGEAWINTGDEFCLKRDQDDVH